MASNVVTDVSAAYPGIRVACLESKTVCRVLTISLTVVLGSPALEKTNLNRLSSEVDAGVPIRCRIAVREKMAFIEYHTRLNRISSVTPAFRFIDRCTIDPFIRLRYDMSVRVAARRFQSEAIPNPI